MIEFNRKNRTPSYVCTVHKDEDEEENWQTIRSVFGDRFRLKRCGRGGDRLSKYVKWRIETDDECASESDVRRKYGRWRPLEDVVAQDFPVVLSTHYDVYAYPKG